MRMNSREESPGEVTGTTLEELERFRQDIERYRARRKAVTEEFEGFVRGFKNPAAPPASSSHDRPAAPKPTPSPAPPPVPSVAAPPVAARPTPSPVPSPPQVLERRPVSPAMDRDVPPDITPARSGRRTWLPFAILAALLVAVAIWQFGRTRSTTPPAEGPAAVTTAPPAVTPAPVAQPPAPPDPHESVLTTTRAVWLRVTADGNRIVSRELPAGARVPFKAEKAIEIRAGDAGAVRLSIGGRDQGALGADGAVVTRSFTVPR